MFVRNAAAPPQHRNERKSETSTISNGSRIARPRCFISKAARMRYRRGGCRRRSLDHPTRRRRVRPVQRAQQRIAEVLRKQAIDVERYRVVGHFEEIRQRPEHLWTVAHQYLFRHGHITSSIDRSACLQATNVSLKFSCIR